MTAIALAESGGNPGAHNPNGEDSRGLWQINMSPQANGNAPWAQQLDLYDPVDNARAAVGGVPARRRHRTVDGDPRRPWQPLPGVPGRGLAAARGLRRDRHRQLRRPGQLRLAGRARRASAASDPPPPLPPPDIEELPTGPGDINRFLEVALAQSGDRYEMNVVADQNDPDPDVFDCSELVEWAAAQVDVDVGTASYLQYLDMKNASALVDVQQALDTPGALLFTFSNEPVPGGGRPSKAHVAISLGDGRVIEARSTRDGVGVFNAGDRFNYAAFIPGMDYANAGVPVLTAPAPACRCRHHPAATGPARHRPDEPGPVDTDVDMLPDHFEIKYGLMPTRPTPTVTASPTATS